MADERITLDIDLNVDDAIATSNKLRDRIAAAFSGKNKNAFPGIREKLQDLIRLSDELKASMASNTEGATQFAAIQERLSEIADMYESLTSLSQGYADALSEYGEEGSAALAAWVEGVTAVGSGTESIDNIFSRVMSTLEEGGITVSDSVRDIISNWSEVFKMMANLDSESEGLNESLNSATGALGEFVTSARQLNTVNSMLELLARKVENVETASRVTTATLAGISKATGKIGSILSTIGRAANTVRNTMKKLFSVIVGVGKRAISIFKGLTAHLSKANKETHRTSLGFGSMLKNILFTIVGVRSLTSIIGTMKSIGIQGIDALAQKFKPLMDQLVQLRVAFLNLKGAIVSMVQPIFSALQPLITTVTKWLTELTQNVARFIAAFTGQNFIYKGVANAAKVAADSVKKLNKQLAGFDELNNLSSDDGNSDPLGFDNIDWVKEPISDKFMDLVEKVKDILRQLFEPLKQAWNKVGSWVISSWKFGLGEVWKLIKDIGRDFLVAWNLGTVQKIFEDLLFVIGAIGRGIGIVGMKIRKAWNVTNEDGLTRGVRLFEAIFKLVRAVTEQMKFLAAYTLNWLAGLSFDNLLEGLITLLEALEAPVSSLAKIVRKFFEDTVLPYIKYLVEKGLPKLGKIIEKFIDKIDWGKFTDNITKIFAPLERAFEAISEGALDFIDILLQGFADLVNSDGFASITQSIADFLDSLDSAQVTNGLLFVVDAIKGFATEIWDFITRIWNSEPVQKFIEWLKGKDGTGEELGQNIAKLVEIFAGLTIVGTLASMFAPFFSILSNIVDLLAHVGELLGSAFLPVIAIIGGVIAALGGLWDAITNGVNWVNSAITTIGLAIAGLGGAILLGISGPIGLLVGAVVGALTMIVLFIMQHWEQIVAWWEGQAVPWLTAIGQMILATGQVILGIIQSVLSTIWGIISSVVGGIFTTLYDLISGAIDTILSLISAVITTIDSVIQAIRDHSVEPLKAIGEAWADVFRNAVETIKTVVANLGNILGGILNSVIGGVEGFLNSIIKGMNTTISGFAKIPGFSGVISLIPELKLPRIPKLAQGAVIPPNKEFLAVLGDQTSGTNIEAPLDTITAAMLQALNQSGAGQGGMDTALLQEQNELLRQLISKEFVISTKQVFNAVRTEAKSYNKATGNYAFS